MSLQDDMDMGMTAHVVTIPAPARKLRLFKIVSPVRVMRDHVIKLVPRRDRFLHTTVRARTLVVWNGKGATGRAVPSGTYVVRLETESGVEARKVMLLR